MAFIPVPDVAQFNIRGTLDNQRIENTLYFRNVNTWDTEGLEAAAALVADWFEDNILPVVTTDYVLREVYAVDLTTENSGSATHTVAASTQGLDSSPALPNNVAICVSFRTAQRGRSFRGRNYIAGLTEADVTGNTIGASQSSALVTAYGQLFSLFPPGGAFWVVVSRFTAGLPRTVGISTPVTAVLIVDSTVDSQRRRLPGRGV